MLISVNTLIDGFLGKPLLRSMEGISQNPENKPDKTAYSLLLPSSPINVSGAAQNSPVVASQALLKNVSILTTVQKYGLISPTKA